MVQLLHRLTAGKALAFIGTDFNVSNRGIEFVLIAKADLNLHLSLSITLHFHMYCNY